MAETRFNRICQRFEDAGYIRGESNSRRYVRYYNPDGGVCEYYVGGKSGNEIRVTMDGTLKNSKGVTKVLGW